MSDEERAFQAAIDADPTDATNRMVFADWLEERGDPRWAGYAALGRHFRCPERTTWSDKDGITPAWMFCCGDRQPWSGWYWKRGEGSRLPDDWSNKIGYRHVNRCRRELEDIAALAFAELPQDRQDEILAPEPIHA